MTGLIVHEWIEKSGGAEKVVDQMMATYSKADLYCLWNDAATRYAGRNVIESNLARSKLRGKKSLAIPFMLKAWSEIDVSATYEWMLISSHLFAHHATLYKQEIPRFVYAHTPARYIWTPDLDPRGNGILPKLAAPLLKSVDKRRAISGGAKYAANSNFVKNRIQRCWEVEADVIYPPVQVSHLQSKRDWAQELSYTDHQILDELPTEYVLGASRFVSYKRLDLVIQAASYSGCPAVIVGSGPEEMFLRNLASKLNADVRFVLAPSDALLYAIIQRANVLVFPGVEDFGILPVESMALGTPVVVNVRGGASESVEHAVSGMHIEDIEDVEMISKAIVESSYLNTEKILERSLAFSSERFSANIQSWIGNEK